VLVGAWRTRGTCTVGLSYWYKIVPITNAIGGVVIWSTDLVLSTCIAQCHPAHCTDETKMVCL